MLLLIRPRMLCIILVSCLALLSVYLAHFKFVPKPYRDVGGSHPAARSGRCNQRLLISGSPPLRLREPQVPPSPSSASGSPASPRRSKAGAIPPVQALCLRGAYIRLVWLFHGGRGQGELVPAAMGWNRAQAEVSGRSGREEDCAIILGTMQNT